MSRPDTVEYRPPPEEAGPPVRDIGIRQWIRENLFDSRMNTAMTLIFGPLLLWMIFRGIRFVFVTGRWEIIRVNLAGFMVGGFPRTELWRLSIAFGVAAAAVGAGIGVIARAAAEEAEARGRDIETSWVDSLRRAGPMLALAAAVLHFVETALPMLVLAAIVAVAMTSMQIGRRLPRMARGWTYLGVIVLLVGAYRFVVLEVPLEAWGGFLLTAFATFATLVAAFPLGVLLALGRRSTLPLVRVVCTAYIEFFRGVPLIALLFMSWLVIGFFLPPGADTPEVITRAMIALIAFTSAYFAEIVRGGLQSVPRGQRESAMAVGLSPWKMTRLIVLPQALRTVIPAIVGQFISLFKDTSLLSTIALTELLRIAQTAPAQARFLGQGLHAESLIFAGFLFWVGSYWMSRESQRLEVRMGIGVR